MSCDNLPTTSEIERAKKDINDFNTFMTSTSDTFVDSAGVSRLTLQGAISKFGFGIADFTFTEGGTLSNRKLVVSNDPIDGFLYRYVGTGSFPITVTAGTDPTIGTDWEAFTATAAEFIGNANGGSVQDFIDDYDLSSIALSLNTRRDYVIYSTDINTILDDVIYIYDSANQKTWAKPSSVGPTENIVSVGIDGLLTTDTATYQMSSAITQGVVTGDAVFVDKNGYNTHFGKVDSYLSNDGFNEDVLLGSDLVSAYSSNKTNETIMDYFTQQSQRFAAGMYWGGTNGGINVIGDSISQGSFAVNNYKNNWVSIVRRNAQIDFESDSYGFVSLFDVGQKFNDNAYKGEVHKVTVNPAWLLKQGVSAQNSPSGFSYIASGAGAGRTITIIVPCFQRKFAIWGNGSIGAGSVTVSVNSVPATTASFATLSNNQTIKSKAADYILKDRGDGFCQIDISTVSSATVELFGLSYENIDNPFQFNNFSHSGRRLREMTNTMIARVCGGCNTLIFALGHNDQVECDADVNLFNDLVVKCNQIVSSCNASKTKLIICDFIWHESTENSRTRKLINDMQFYARKSVYVPFPDYFTIDQENGHPYTRDTLHLLDDYSHPNILGHKLIGETVSRAMGLSHISKNQPIEKCQFFPVDIASSGLVGNGGGWPFVTSIKMSDQQAIIKVHVGVSGGGIIPKGSYTLTNIGVGDNTNQKIPAVLSINDEQYGNIGVNNNAPVIPAVIELTSAGNIVIHVKDNISSAFINLTTIAGVFTFNLQTSR